MKKYKPPRTQEVGYYALYVPNLSKSQRLVLQSSSWLSDLPPTNLLLGHTPGGFAGPPILQVLPQTCVYLHAVRSAAIGEHVVWILCCIEHVGPARWHKHHEKDFCKYILFSLVSARILHLILETDFYFYSYDNCIMQNYKPFTRLAHQGALRMVQGMLCEFILKEIIDPKGNFYDISDAMWVHCSVLNPDVAWQTWNLQS